MSHAAPTDRERHPLSSTGRQPPTPTTPAAPALRERSTSQHNTLAIRIVPYSPPRLGEGSGQESSSSSSRPYATEGQASGSGNEEPSRSLGGGAASTPGWSRGAAVGKEVYASSQGSALSSPTSPTFSLARSRDDGVSGSKPATNRVSSHSTASGSHLSQHAIKTPAKASAGGDGDPDATPASPTSSTTPRPRSRRRNFITVHADKTFSLQPRGGAGGGSVTPSDTHASLRSPPLSFSSTVRSSSSHEGLYSDALSDDRPSSPPTTTATTVPDLYSLSAACTPSPGSSTIQLPLIEDPIPASSPWNYRMVGGLRKVPKTPDLKQKRADYAFAPSSSSSVQPPPSTLPPLPEASSPTFLIDDQDETPLRPPRRAVLPKTSFASERSDSTLSETTNYKVYGHSSSPAGHSSDSLPRPRSSDSNIQLLGESSPPRPVFESSPLPPRTADSDQNYVVHGDPSPLASSVIVSRQPRPTYSQESLKVAPLQPTRKASFESFGYFKSRSRESLRHAASIQSLSSIISQESIAPFLVAPAFLNIRGSSAQGSSSRKPDSWASTPKALPPPPSDSDAEAEADTVPPLPSLPELRVQMVEAHPHQWSSQLSTVMSESEDEGESSRLPSRSVSMGSGAHSRSDNRRSSTGWASSHSRQMLSISSSLAQQLDETRTHSRSDSRGDSVMERPWATYARPAVARMVRDPDEHGDGLTDLHQVQQQPSRSGLSGFFSSSNSSGRNLHSSGSSRANSLTNSSLPAWARVYYGSGERKRFASAISLASTDDLSRPTSAFHNSGSPTTDHFPLNIYSARKRAREVHPRGPRRDSDVASLDVSQLEARRGLRHMTSSIWSPHLRTDRRASRYSVWDPPSVQWSADSGGVLGRRNAQVVLFMVGFLMPFAWMVAAFLPIPPDPKSQKVREKGKSPVSGPASDAHSEEFVAMPGAFKRQLAQAEEKRYQSAKWWRTLNRVMAVFGLLILGAIAALVYIGVRDGWGQGMPS